MYMYGNAVSLYYKTAEWMFMKFGREEVLFDHICPGADPGEAKIG